MSSVQISQSNRGKIVSEETRQKLKKCKNRAKEYEFLDPNGNIVKFKNLKQFSLENGLNRNQMRLVYQGRLKQHCGWRKITDKQ